MSDPTTDSQTNYVKWFRNSAPYINAHRGKTFVLMLSGEAVAHDNFDNIVHDIALLNSLGVRLVLVHGARPQIEERVVQAGLQSRFHRDLRITDEREMRCVTDATGSLRSHIEALLSMGVANSPMHGAFIRVSSGNFVTARPLGILDGVDYKHTGVVRRIDAQGLQQQLHQGQIVILSPLGYSPTGEIFNLTAEDVAVHTARALQADKLILFTAEEGLLNHQGELIEQCEYRDVDNLVAKNTALGSDTIVQAAVNAGDLGIQRCHLISYREDGALLSELFTRDGAGTLITQEHFEHLHTASIDDVGGILAIIEPLEQQGVLLKRSRELLETEIEHFKVLEQDGMIIACAALYPYPEQRSGEIACVATHPDYRGADRAERLLAELEKAAARQGLNQVFVLTTQTAHWFQEQGYVECPVDDLPPAKRELYNCQRNSKAFIKTLAS
ncbi:amino-acid N-acetyltransferase [Spongiibacter nanhainus]|uniref:Amino-acid acetyltransferase n=1 Tax=Spongiibacter nanhainus TaxID=2794344 RepID=A0A7T4URM2_9GAMM|nr:amino-acid N-acetyltransferase [Spongiibacter nanhainus]QQD18515.1 amino-acid N-acetyltransferase [Spongiibacter nanhainus]